MMMDADDDVDGEGEVSVAHHCPPMLMLEMLMMMALMSIVSFPHFTMCFAA